MGAIFGVVGQGSLAELEGMRRRLTHRGSFHQLWSPAPGVYFGRVERHPFQVDCSCPLTEDAQLDDPAGGAGLAECLERDGAEAVERLRGCFALAHFDPAKHRLLLAVDQVGYKVLHYTLLSDRLAFASEYKALLALPDLDPEPDREAIQRYLATRFQWIGHTLLARIRSLGPGRMLQWEAGSCRVASYWEPDLAIAHRSRGDHAVAVRESLLRTVARQLRGRDEVGITIGGGLDAAAVVGAIRRVAPAVAVKSFTIGGTPDDPELLGGRETARVFGTEHREIVFSREAIPDDLPRLIWLSEDCGGREEALLQMRVLALAGQHARLVMGGHGADVLFGGMPRHRLVAMAEVFPPLRAPLRELFFLSQSGKPTHSLAGRALQRWFYGGHYPAVPAVPGAGVADPVIWDDRLDGYIRRTVQDNDTLRYLEPQHEAAGTEFRSPFLDPDFIVTSLTVPAALKVRWGRSKAILRDAVADLLPVEISRRPKAIQRVGQAHGRELGQVLGRMAERVLPDGALESHGILPRTTMREIYEYAVRPLGTHAGGRREQVYRLWTVLALECWARIFLERRGAIGQLDRPD